MIFLSPHARANQWFENTNYTVLPIEEPTSQTRDASDDNPCKYIQTALNNLNNLFLPLAISQEELWEIDLEGQINRTFDDIMRDS